MSAVEIVGDDGFFSPVIGSSVQWFSFISGPTDSGVTYVRGASF